MIAVGVAAASEGRSVGEHGVDVRKVDGSAHLRVRMHAYARHEISCVPLPPPSPGVAVGVEGVEADAKGEECQEHRVRGAGFEYAAHKCTEGAQGCG